MIPTDAEVCFWVIVGIVIIGFALYSCIFNLDFDPKANDPYRYCPKD